jgi:hypothetical protein
LTKSRPKFYANPTQDPRFDEFQTKWYGRLVKQGFVDIEDSAYEGRPLKRWSGIDQVYVDISQPPLKPVVSSFPESNYKEQESFLRHQYFQEVCEKICAHGNSKLTPKKVRLIWKDYTEGRTIREAESRYQVSDTTALRVIHRITEWMNLMDTRPNNPGLGEQVATIVIRDFKPETDSPIIYSSWRNSLWYDEKRDERLANEFYYKATQGIKKLLAQSNTKVRIACAKDEPDFIAGYAVMTGNHLEFCYIKINYRKKGIATLLAKNCTSFAHPSTKIGKKIAEDHHLIIKDDK